jgi:hypothetical protein
VTASIPSPFKGDPPQPANKRDQFWITVDILDSADMRALWVAVDRDGLSKPLLENARKHVGMSDADMVRRVRLYLAHTTPEVRESVGAQYLTDWYAPVPEETPELAQDALFDMGVIR